MAIDFHHGPRALVEGLERAGYKVTNVLSDAGDPRKSLQIILRNGITVNWDRDSQSVWAEGDRPRSQKVESAIERFAPRRNNRGRGKGVKRWLLLFLLIVAAAVAAYRYLPQWMPAKKESASHQG